jgi:hypothetical protein
LHCPFKRQKLEAVMVQESRQDRGAFAQMVKDSLRKAQEHTSSLRRANTRLIITGMLCSAGTTLVAGGTAVTGPLVGVEDAGWRLACIVAAIFAFASTICTALTTQLKFDERLAQGNQCVGRLRALEVAITTGAENWGETTKEYGEIVKVYSEIIG